MFGKIRTAAAFSIILFGISGVSGALSDVDEAIPFSGFADARLLEPGDVVAMGTSSGEGCHFDGFGLSVTGKGTNEGYIVNLQTDDACNLVVQESRTGTISTPKGEGETHSDAGTTLLPADPLPSTPTPESSAGAGGGGSTSYPTGQKVVMTYLWMYGYGGPDDRLTIKEGQLKFAYQGGIAWMVEHQGFCDTWEPWWDIDSCYLNGSGSQPNHVWRKATGKYHCHPPSNWPCNMSSPDGYYHSLITQENGYADGSYRCDAWYSGDIVAGTLYYCSSW